MYEIIKAGGWLMLPILLASVLSLAIIVERYWTLRRRRIIPDGLVEQIEGWVEEGRLGSGQIEKIQKGSPLGRLLVVGLNNINHPRDIMKESIEEAGRHEAHEMERYLNTLGSIASGAPLAGLLGTVIGMIKVFNAIAAGGIGDPAILSEGISEALITTAAGLSVAIPSLIFHRYLRGRVVELMVFMEQETIKLVENMHGQWQKEAG